MANIHEFNAKHCERWKLRAVAEHALAHILAFTRHIHTGRDRQRRHDALTLVLRALPRRGTGPTRPSAAQSEAAPAYSARDPKGCELGQRWVVEGMGHYWSGGSTDPKYTGEQTTPSGGTAPGFNDPKGPSASQASWDFFKQFSLANGNVTCSR